MKRRPAAGRKVVDTLIKGVSILASALGIFFLGWILLEVTMRGVTSLNWAFFTELPTPPGIEGGGLANAIVGTLLITVLATLMGVPIGIAAGGIAFGCSRKGLGRRHAHRFGKILHPL